MMLPIFVRALCEYEQKSVQFENDKESWNFESNV
jgi:hypothetical protein